MHMQDLRRPAAFVQIVNILRDKQQFARKFALQSGQRHMRWIGFHPAQRLAPFVIKAKYQIRVASKAFGCGDIFNLVLLLQAASRTKRVDPAFCRNSRACKDDDAFVLCHGRSK